MRWMAVVLVAIAAAWSCAKSARDLSPFPCALDLTCPEGLACVNGQCADATIDSICTTGDDPTDCSVAGSNARCSASSGVGECAQPCAAEADCPAGRACTGGPGATCLVECTNGQACPQFTVCEQRSFDTRKLCVPPKSCTATQNVTACDQGCQALTTAVTCPNGTSTCPSGSTCDAMSQFCTCVGALVPVTCPGGTACGNLPPGSCGGNAEFDFICAPDPREVNCNSDQRNFRGDCVCRGGRLLPFNCGLTTITCEQACAQ